MEITGTTHSVRYNITEFLQLLDEDTWNSIVRDLEKDIDDKFGEKGFKYQDRFEEKGSIEFLFSD